MDRQLKQSIEFDIEQLEILLQNIERDIQDKEREFQFISSKVKGVGVGVGAAVLASGLTALTGLATRNPTLIAQSLSIGALKGGEFGYETTEKALQILETDIVLLKRERDNLLIKIKTAQDKLDK